MRQTLLTFSFCLSALCCVAQNAPTTKSILAPTSQEEYNYATKGLKTQRAQGLDLKAGYTLESKTEIPLPSATVTIEDLVRKADNTLACVIVEVTTPKLTEPLYLAIPNSTSGGDLFKQYAKAVSEVDPAIAKTVLYCVSARLGGMTTAVYKIMK